MGGGAVNGRWGGEWGSVEWKMVGWVEERLSG